MEKKQPVKKYRAGAISATIWENKVENNGEQVTYNSITIERGYKDKEGNWQSTSSYRLADLPKVMLVSQKAYEFLAMADNSNKVEEVQVK